MRHLFPLADFLTLQKSRSLCLLEGTRHTLVGARHTLEDTRHTCGHTTTLEGTRHTLKGGRAERLANRVFLMGTLKGHAKAIPELIT